MGGLVAGLALGFVETMTYTVLSNGWSDFSVLLPTLFWALAAYGLLGLLKIASRYSDDLGDYEIELVERFLPHATVAMRNLNRAESLELGMLEAEKKSAVANLARGVAAALIDAGEVPRSWIGLSFKPIEGTGLEHGVLVNSVVSTGPADTAGINAGDVIVEIDGEPVTVRFVDSEIAANEVELRAIGQGGWSVLDPDDASIASAATDAVSRSGVGDHDRLTYRRFLADSSTSLIPFIDETSEGFVGWSATEDVEILFQQMHLSVTAPRVEGPALRQTLDDIVEDRRLVETDTWTASQAALADGLREALRVGTERVVSAIGKADGFNADPEIHIPLPNYLRDVQSALELIGAGSMGQDLELKLNRAAEAAAPEARELFVDSISQMTLDDVKAIYDGPDDAAGQDP